MDFIQPEFLNILFFEQQNIVIFPYVDLKHLHALEIFAVGYNIIDLESTALYNIKEIIEFETNNSYSQNHTLFFIYNINKEKLQEIINIPGIRCILNTHENVADFVQEKGNYIFYNKKNKTFLNYQKTDAQLQFEQYLISSSENESHLNEKLQQIKILATRIFTEINKDPDFHENIPEILKDFPLTYWEKILDFTRRYFNIEIPVLNFAKKKYQPSAVPSSNQNEDSPVSTKILSEFEFIANANKFIFDEFVQMLHEYRSKRIDSRYLDLEQLYHPQKIYQYLRTHHWKEKIDLRFVKDWVQMKLTGYTLTEPDIENFERIFEKFNLPKTILANIPTDNPSLLNDSITLGNFEIYSKESSREASKKYQKNPAISPKLNKTPSILYFEQFKRDILEKLDQIDILIGLMKNKDD